MSTLLGKRLSQREYKPIWGVWEGTPHFCQSTSYKGSDLTEPQDQATVRGGLYLALLVGLDEIQLQGREYESIVGDQRAGTLNTIDSGKHQRRYPRPPLSVGG